MISVLMLAVLLLMPYFVGRNFRLKSIPFTYLMGQAAMWAVFQILAVPMIYLRAEFDLLFWSYTGIAAALVILGGIRGREIRVERPEISAFTILAIGVILFQCGTYVLGMHLDEDDARWLAEANDALVKGKMLLYNPATGAYFGKFTGDFVKDLFSPWSMYLAWMSRMTGIRVATVAHTVYPPMLLMMSYAAYDEIGKQIFEGRREKGIFLLAAALLNLFFAGNVYTQSVFSLTRIWQGKAVVAAVVVPLLLAVFLRISGCSPRADERVENIQSLRRKETEGWLMMGIISCAACLMSGMGIAIGALMVGIYGGCAVIRNWQRIPLWLVAMLPPVIYGLGYFWIKKAG